MFGASFLYKEIVRRVRSIHHRPVALMVERRSPKPDVEGSSPSWPVASVFESIKETS